MTAVLGGLGAAATFTVTALLVSRATTFVPGVSLAAVALSLGLLLVLPFVIGAGIPDGLDAESGRWLVISGVANATAFACSYTSLGLGQVGAVAPIMSTEGAFAALFAILAGEEISGPVGVSLVVIAVGVSLAATGSRRHAVDRSRARTAVALALVAAVLFGMALYAVGRASTELPIAWVLMPTRVFGAIFIALPLWLRGDLSMPVRALPYAAAIAVLEASGWAFYAIGARESLAVTAVLCSQFAAFAAVAAAILFHERLSRMQVAGLVTTAIGVAALSVLQ